MIAQRKRLLNVESLWLQLLLWGVVFLMPVMFMPPDEEFSLGLYLRRCPYPMAMVTAFYINYLWLAPNNLMVKNRQTEFWVMEVLMVLLLSVGVNRWMEYDHQTHHLVTPHTHGHHHKEGIEFFGFIRDLYFISASATLGCAIPISRRWIESEQARQEADMARQEAEIKNLRNQVSPHFLLNTLNNIYALTAFDQHKAQDAVLHLSRMLRHLLYRDEQPYVNLKAEVDFIHNYIDLMRIRYDKNVVVNEYTDIPDPCSIMIAPMIIISLVENAFKHGISPTEPSEIDVRFSANKESITIDIQNTNFPKDKADKSGHGIGLTQVLNRLELDYKGKYVWVKGLTEDQKHYQSKIILYDTELRNH